MTPRAAHPWPGALEWGGDWLADAADELAHLGFVLRDGGHPGTIPGPRLLVAFRDQPTLAHFDPEEATYWAAKGGRCEQLRLDRTAVLPVSRAFAWGRIEVTDRIPVSNQFLSFGGTVLADSLDERIMIAAFVSKAPIVRWAGHSQISDPFMDEIGAFFGRVHVPVDYQANAEARVAATSPEGLYAAFLAHAARRRRPGNALRAADPRFASFVDHERGRVCRDAPTAWREGCELLDWLELG